MVCIYMGSQFFDYSMSRYDPHKRITAAQALEHEYGYDPLPLFFT